MTSRDLTLALAAAATDAKGLDVRVLDVRQLTSMADFFLLASGTSDRHVRRLAEAVQESGRKLGQRPLGAEGQERARWILVDYGSVIVHVFQEEVREFYALERLWGEAGELELPLAVAGGEI
ncbi:MAG: ribosome silencing factor [Myxococcota bacterium]